MRRDLPVAIIVPAVMVGFAVVLMIWALSGSSGARMASPAPAVTTTGAVSPRPNDSAGRSPAAAANGAAVGGAR